MKLLDLMPKSGSADMVHKLEQIGAAVLGAALFALLSRFLPFWADGLLLAGIVVAGFYLAEEYLVGVVSFAILAGFYLLLVQPTMMLAFSVLAGLAAAVAAVYFLIEARLWQILLAALAAMVGTTALVTVIFMALYAYVLPGLHPLTVWFFNISPAVSVVSTLAIIAYASFRQPVEEDSYYWLTVPALSLLFVLFFWPSHSYLAAAVVGSVALGLSLLAYLNRPTWEKRGRSHLTLVAATVCGVIFAAWFTVANRWEWFYNYQMANAITVNRHELSEIPVTKPTRLVPLIAAVDFCSQGNHPSYTDFGAEPHPKLIVINKDGQEKQFWQCLRYPTRPQGHLVTWLTGGIEGFILSDAGTRGRFSDEIDENFLFGDHSLFTRAVFNARHPGSTMEEGVVGRSVDGKYALLIPYVSRSLQWGGMIPDFSGVMVLSPWGFVEDLTPAQAAARYPGVPLYPAQLARQYAELWAQESSVYAKVWSGDMLEVSEFSDETDNRYPFWQNFDGGVRGVIPFEPVGKNQNVLAAIGLFNRAALTMDIYYTPRPKDKDVSAAGLQVDFPGPKQIVANVALSHPGMNQVRTVEALLNVSACKQIFWSTALLQTDKKAYHGYSTNVVYDSHAEKHEDVDSSAQLAAFVARFDENCKAGGK